MHSVAPRCESSPSVVVAEPSRWLLRAIAATTFLGAFLLFQVQPLIGNVVLPWFGGTPTVWTTSMLFFQAMLVVGYGFVYLTTRFMPPRARSFLYLACTAACTAMLPILPDVAWKPTPEADPTTGVLVLLFACVGAPYFLLSTTGPTTQEWFARAYGNRSPYRLYSLSNLGSLLGLLTYPFLIQPLLDLSVQSQIWSIGFVAYAALMAFCAWSVRGYAALPPVTEPAATAQIKTKGRKQPEANSATAADRWKEAGKWLALSAGGSILLLATTNHLCQDISSFPLLWIAPLVVYLTTFIIAFDRPAWYQRTQLALAAMVLVPLACLPELENAGIKYVQPRFLLVAVVDLAMLFTGCMLCHGELAARKPEPQRLTFYFLVVAVGGAIGGLFVGIIAPLIYNLYWEWILASPALFLFAAILTADTWTKSGRLARIPAKGLFVAAIVGGLALIARNHYEASEKYLLASARNFYGVVQVSGFRPEGSDDLQWASMRSGTTRHGTQLFQDLGVKTKISRLPTTYFGKDSGVGRLLLYVGGTRPTPMRIGIVGLGVGTLATYARKGDVVHFYEINPIVVEFAEKYFTYLKECPGNCEIILGDARLTMEREPDQDYDILVLDAFSSDAVPTHLLTTQAFEIYLRHLDADGMLALHISNKYVDLTPVVAAAAKHFGLHGLIVDSGADTATLQKSARWVLLSRNPASPLWRGWSKENTSNLESHDWIRPWTDERSNMLEILE